MQGLPNLPDFARRELLALARLTLEKYLHDREISPYKPIHEDLQKRFGAFVTLRRNGDLRGCIGRLFPDEELYLTVQHCAVSAAVEDGRFPPVTPEELSLLQIEISVLGEFIEVRGPEEIRVGTHGLWIVRGSQRGLLLPQVAIEFDWNREQFLRETCRKAGLPPECWREQTTTVHKFEAEVFGES